MFLTVIFGVLVFAIQQLVLKFFIEPYYSAKQTIGKIAASLMFYSRLYCNYFEGSEVEKKDRVEASDKIRQLGMELLVKISGIPCYDKLFDLKRIKEASRSLVLISNRMFVTTSDSKDAGSNILIKNKEEADGIFTLLNIKFKPD